MVGDIDQLGALPNEPVGDERRLVLVVDAPRGLDLERVGNLVRRLLGVDTPMVYLHYPRRQPAISERGAGRALKPINSLQLWLAMAEAIAPGGEQAVPLSAGPPGSQAPSDAGHLLVAEDDDINAKLIESLLRKFGCKVTLVRNGQAASKVRVQMPYSKLKEAVAKVLKDQGYIRDYGEEDQDGHRQLSIVLKYYQGKPVIEKLQRISRPGLRVYKSKDQLPKVLDGLGIAVVSTSHGLMTDRAARAAGYGGEIVCTVE